MKTYIEPKNVGERLRRLVQLHQMHRATARYYEISETNAYEWARAVENPNYQMEVLVAKLAEARRLHS